ncbi:polysaccharide lyase family 7 protein [Pseudonocardia zijingensis]|jgi:hypothetical protein|uniref:Polysaccharide lyase family 7 protein n=2 Tax=Pseudonocardia zijingensis TaxID=153376 RepID=A0ABN1NDF4_9PSEU
MLAVAAVVLVVGGGLVWLVLGTGGSGPGGPSAPGPVALQGWKLTLPVEGDDGDAESVDPAAPTDPWLTTGPDGGLTFWAPASGATTKNSDHPRTELISTQDFTAGEDGPHTLAASLAVTQVPSDTKDIIIGQIHGSDDIKSVPYVMLHYRDGEIRAIVKQKQKGDEKEAFTLLTGVPLDERFDISITDAGDGSMTISATHAGSTQQATAQVPEAFRGEPVRFQVGAYQQADNPQGDDDGGRVTFYDISQ